MANKDLFEHDTKKEFNFFLAIIPLAVMVITMLYAIVLLETDPHLPLMIGTITAAIVAVISGFKFDDLEEMMYKGVVSKTHRTGMTKAHAYPRLTELG